MADSKGPQAGETSDVIGAFPRIYDADALPLRRLSAYARIISIVAAVEGVAIVSLSLAIAAMLPLQKVVPLAITSNLKDNEVIHVNPLTLDSPTGDYITEVALRQYITDRYSIVANANQQSTKWAVGGPVQMMSTTKLYQDFVQKAQAQFNFIRTQNLVRSVHIERVSKLGEFTWQVEYTTNDTPEASPVTPVAPTQSKAWVATMEVHFTPRNVTYSQRLINPLGLLVTQINEAQRD